MTVSEMRFLCARMEDDGLGNLEICLDLTDVREGWWGVLSNQEPGMKTMNEVDFKVLPYGQRN
jgi:hypothetical protein